MALFCVISANSGSFRAHCVKVHVRYLISWWVLVYGSHVSAIGPNVVPKLRRLIFNNRLPFVTKRKQGKDRRSCSRKADFEQLHITLSCICMTAYNGPSELLQCSDDSSIKIGCVRTLRPIDSSPQGRFDPWSFRGKTSVRNVRTFVHNAGRGQLSSEWRHNENDVIMIIGNLWRLVTCGRGLQRTSDIYKASKITQDSAPVCVFARRSVN